MSGISPPRCTCDSPLQIEPCPVHGIMGKHRPSLLTVLEDMPEGYSLITVERLRELGIYEADYNKMCKKVGEYEEQTNIAYGVGVEESQDRIKELEKIEGYYCSLIDLSAIQVGKITELQAENKRLAGEVERHTHNTNLLGEIHEELVERENNRSCYSDFELIEKIENEQH